MKCGTTICLTLFAVMTLSPVLCGESVFLHLDHTFSGALVPGTTANVTITTESDAVSIDTRAQYSQEKQNYVKVYFANRSKKITEIELTPTTGVTIRMYWSPHNPYQTFTKENMPNTVSSEVTIDGDYWLGKVTVPNEFLPPDAALYNAAAAVHTATYDYEDANLYSITNYGISKPDKYAFFNSVGFYDANNGIKGKMVLDRYLTLRARVNNGKLKNVSRWN